MTSEEERQRFLESIEKDDKDKIDWGYSNLKDEIKKKRTKK